MDIVIIRDRAEKEIKIKMVHSGFIFLLSGLYTFSSLILYGSQ